MRTFTTILFLILSCSFIWASNIQYIDSLIQVTEKMENSEDKVENLLAISREYHLSDISLSEKYANEARQISKAIGYSKGEAYAYKALGIVEDIRGNYELSLAQSQESVALAQEINDSVLLSDNFNNIGLYYQRSHDLITSLEYLNLSLKFHNNKRPKYKLGYTYLNIAHNHSLLKNFLEAESYLTRVSTMSDFKKGTPFYPFLLFDKAHFHSEKEEFDISNSIINELKEITNKDDNLSVLVESNTLLAENYFAINEYAEALDAIKEAERMNEKLSQESLFPLNKIKGRIFLRQGNVQKGIDTQIKNLKLAQQSGNPKHLSDANLYLSEAYSFQNQPQKAFKYFSQYRNIEDSLAIAQQAKIISTLDFKRQLEVKQQENLSLLEQQRVQMETIDSNKKLNGWIMTAFLLLMVILAQYLFAYSRQRKVNQELNQLVEERTNEIVDLNANYSMQLIQDMEDEKSRISKELHDHIGQELLLIKHESVRAENDALSGRIDGIIEDLRGISKNLSPVALQKFGLKKALENLCDRVDQSTEKIISHDIDDLDKLFKHQSALNIFRIVQEALNNVLKHSDGTAARVNLKRENDRISLTILDNGKGMENLNDNGDIKGIGMYTMEQRAKAIGGELSFGKNKNGDFFVSLEKLLNS